MTKDICISLDTDTVPEARTIFRDTLDLVWGFKLGPRLLLAPDGAELARAIMHAGLGLILDLKLHDTPDAVTATLRRVEAISMRFPHGGAYVTVWVDALTNSPPLHVRQLAVWSLTTSGVLRYDDLQRSVKHPGTGGLICPGVSPITDIACDMMEDENRIIPIFSPGIRMPGDKQHDQRYVAAPCEARRSGVDVLIVGRSVIKDANPRARLAEMTAE